MANPLIYIDSIAYNGESWILILVDKTRGRIYLSLSTIIWTDLTEEDLQRVYEAIESDGCTGVPDFYLCSCIKHDFWYCTHRDFDGNEITRAEADARFRKDIQSRSLYGPLSPMSWWRWLAVRIFGKKPWNKEEWR